MSVDYYLVCHECRKRIHVAQHGLGGWSFYSGERDCMRQLSAWFCEHTLDHDASHRFVLHSEDEISSEDYEEIEWRPRGLG
jgi:hypothetical protein